MIVFKVIYIFPSQFFFSFFSFQIFKCNHWELQKLQKLQNSLWFSGLQCSNNISRIPIGSLLFDFILKYVSFYYFYFLVYNTISNGFS